MIASALWAEAIGFWKNLSILGLKNVHVLFYSNRALLRPLTNLLLMEACFTTGSTSIASIDVLLRMVSHIKSFASLSLVASVLT